MKERRLSVVDVPAAAVVAEEEAMGEGGWEKLRLIGMVVGDCCCCWPCMMGGAWKEEGGCSRVVVVGLELSLLSSATE